MSKIQNCKCLLLLQLVSHSAVYSGRIFIRVSIELAHSLQQSHYVIDYFYPVLYQSISPILAITQSIVYKKMVLKPWKIDTFGYTTFKNIPLEES